LWDKEAEFSMGEVYYDGLGVPQNYIESLKWFRKAEKNGHPDAACRIGRFFRYGRGVAVSYNTARKWFLKGYKKGSKMATIDLGLLYRYGQGVRKNLNVAEKYFEKYAQQDYRFAEANLGLLYEHDFKDKQRAIEMYSIAADLGHVKSSEACVRLQSEGYTLPVEVKRKKLIYILLDIY
jgi:TPR repeat protein